MPVLSQAACARAGSESHSLRPGVREREHAAATDDSESKHQLQWTRSILSREYHASAVTGTLAGSLSASESHSGSERGSMLLRLSSASRDRE